MAREMDASQRTANGSAAVTRLEHVNDRVLPGDDLGLVHQSDGHDAHGENAERENQAHLGFRSRDMKDAAHPRHGDTPMLRITRSMSRKTMGLRATSKGEGAIGVPAWSRIISTLRTRPFIGLF